MMKTKNAEPKKFYEVESDKHLSIYDLDNCEYIGKLNLWNANIFEIGESSVVKTVDSILESYDKNLFDNRFGNHLDLIMVDSETLNPEARLEYFIDDEAEDKQETFLDVVEHDIRCIFSMKLAEIHGRKETYVTPEMELLRQKELAEIEEEEYKKEHTMVCPSCGDIAINQAPNGAGILESCDFYCACGWQEEQIGGGN